MKGKEKCKALKEIRRQIAQENDIPYVVSQCTHQGDCKGTCPKCESELRYLERELALRQGLGKAVAVVGISTSVCAGLTACSPVDMVRDALGIQSGVQTSGAIMPVQELYGDIQYYPESGAGEGDGNMPSESQPIPGGMAETLPEGETETQESEECVEPRGTQENGETEELLMGELPPPEEQPEETRVVLDGDIAPQEMSEETAP